MRYYIKFTLRIFIKFFDGMDFNLNRLFGRHLIISLTLIESKSAIQTNPSTGSHREALWMFRKIDLDRRTRAARQSSRPLDAARCAGNTRILSPFITFYENVIYTQT